jgi:hypothetical protein
MHHQIFRPGIDDVAIDNLPNIEHRGGGANSGPSAFVPAGLKTAANGINSSLPASLQTSCEDYIQDRGDLIHTFAPAGGNVTDLMSADTGVRYVDGVVSVRTTDLSSDALGLGWGMTRDWTNMANQADNLTGNGMVETDLPTLRDIPQDGQPDTYAAVTNGYNARYFDSTGGPYGERFFGQDVLTVNTAAKEILITDTLGDQLRFNDFTVTPTGKQGTFKSFTDPYGNVTSVVSYTSAGKP